MPSKFPSTQIWVEMSELIGCDIPTIKAIFEVEASGKFYNDNGSLPRRFEPHHFPKKFWGELGFAPGTTAPWRASLKVSTANRRKMFDIAQTIDREAAYKAASWGAPQIMGFNATVSGFKTAVAMVEAFEESADNQIRAFVAFVITNNLDTHMRSQNWLSFASGYNGSGQAAVYAAKIESAYRRQSGGQRSAPYLTIGSKGKAVRELQVQLNGLGYDIDVDGVYGGQTFKAVKLFQAAHNLVVDGKAGATTLRTLAQLQENDEDALPIEAPVQERAETIADRNIDTVVKYGSTVLGAGGVTGLLSNLNEASQTILVGGVVAGGILLAGLYLLKKRI